jgi:outer membrane receptor for ferrienterochelin and colicin
MNYLIRSSILLTSLLVVLNIQAQSVAQRTNPGVDSSRIYQQHEDTYRYNKMNEVIQGSGKSFNSNQLQQMAAKDVNQIANTVSGVQARAGEPVIIRGISNGTAYFVDGVRVYGALPPIMK